MTTHYIDITLLPDPEFSHTHLLGALVSKLHRALVQAESSDIGTSYPGNVCAPVNRRTLGSVLRLHGTEAALLCLMGLPWLKGMRDHVQISDLRPAPAHAVYRTVRRRQFKTSAERLRRRRMKRHGETAAQAESAVPATMERRPDLPFVQLRSSSTGQAYCLFVDHGPIQEQAQPGPFNSFGLGQDATVPWF